MRRFSAEVAFHMLDALFSTLIPTIYRFGGDVLRIPGDALYIVWVDPTVRVRVRAVLCCAVLCCAVLAVLCWLCCAGCAVLAVLCCGCAVLCYAVPCLHARVCEHAHMCARV